MSTVHQGLTTSSEEPEHGKRTDTEAGSRPLAMGTLQSGPLDNIQQGTNSPTAGTVSTVTWCRACRRYHNERPNISA